MESRFKYKYSIDQCDILDKKKGEEFRKKRMQWMEWLNGRDPYSITQQISSMLWDHAFFLVVNELRKIAAEEPDDQVGFNESVISLFDVGFVTTQALAIRRLIERPKNNPKWAVISLRRILKDIEDNLDLITRENYVCYDGLPYDYHIVQDKWLSRLPSSSHGTISNEGPNAWPTAERCHNDFDILSQIDSKNRSRKDMIKRKVPEYLEKEIQKCENIKTYADKFIAHAADPETKTGLSDEEKGLTLERLESYQKTIYQVASFISGLFLWESNQGGLPVPQYDHLKNLDKSWVIPKNLDKARNKWNEFSKIISKWDSYSLWPPGFKEDLREDE